jgi:hypothetical protein
MPPLPALLCPFSARGPYPEAEALVSRTLEWALQQQLVTERDNRTFAGVRSYSLLAASCYPSAPFERLTAISDYYSWLFFFDDACERLSLDGANPRDVGAFLRNIYGALEGRIDHANPSSRFAVALADIWRRISSVCPPAWRLRLVRHVANYIDGCVWEAQNRYFDEVPSRSVFQAMRMFTSTMYEFWDLIEYAGDFFLPDDVVEHPVMVELRRAANAVASYANDIFSLRKELNSGDFHNLVLVLQREEGLDLAAAYGRAAALHDEQVRYYLELECKVPAFDPAMDRNVSRYLDGMRSWMRANYDWSITTPRYN